MSLAPGDRIGPYEIVAFVGEGGMGRVYRARDQKLARNVAIKVLPDAFARDADRLARFRREAQALAALNHPHIAQIYQLEEFQGRAALVMEFVEGRGLDEAIRSGLERDEAVQIAREIAAGLETAHEVGIIHRDLKPANVKITADGHAKILDFGLAKAMSGENTSTELMNSPTVTAHATESGIILGTAAYMSPEQARGRPVDKRTDIWAFGAVLYEMLTGERAFKGENVSDTLASVLRSDPDWSRLPAAVPPHVRALLMRCLDRDSTRRLRDIGEARLALDEHGAAASSTPVTQSAGRARPWGWIAATVVLGLTLVTLLLTSSTFRPPETVDEFETAVSAPAGTEFRIDTNTGAAALSPDGTKIAFVVVGEKQDVSLWLRSLARDDARRLANTEGASNPFWSPDSRRIGFFAEGKLKIVDIAGGMPESIATVGSSRGGTWSDDGSTIIFAPRSNTTLFSVAASGDSAREAPQALTELDLTRGESGHYWPHFLPGGKQYLYLARSYKPENSGVYLGHLDGTPARRVLPSLSSAILAKRANTDEWFLLWADDNNLLGQRFDVGSATPSGDVSVLAKGVRVDESLLLMFVSASRHGHVAWATSRGSQTAVSLRNRHGNVMRWLNLGAGRNNEAQLSPNGTQVLFTKTERGSSDIYLHDLETNNTRRITNNPEADDNPRWTADGRAVIYGGRSGGPSRLFYSAVSGGGPPIRVGEPDRGIGVETPDGHIIAQVGQDGPARFVAYAPPDFTVSVPVASLPAGFGLPTIRISPDGWAFLVRGGTVGLARLEQTKGGFAFGPPYIAREGVSGAWFRRDGNEIFVRMPDGFLHAIPVTKMGGTASFGTPVSLFPLALGVGLSANADGTQFVVSETPNAIGQTIRLLTRWEARLK